MTEEQDERPEQVESLVSTPHLADALESEQFRRFLDQVPIAIVVAETLDQAEYAASRVRIEYAPESPRLDFTGGLEHAVAPDAGLLANAGIPADTSRTPSAD